MSTRRAFASCLILAYGLLLCSLSPVPAGAQKRLPLTTAVDRGMAEAEQALRDNEPQLAESGYRSALLEGWLLLGSLKLEEGDLEGAMAAFERASTAAVETRRARTSLALVRLELGDALEAVTLLRGVIRSDSSDFAARRLLSQALAASGQNDEAVQELEELHILAPEDLENTYLLASAYLHHRNPEAAEPFFAELAEKRPIPQTHVLIGRTYRDAQHYDRARQSLELALEMDPDVRRAHYYLGTVDLFEQGQQRIEEAMEHFEAELRVAPDDPMANLYLGMALVERRRHEEAVPRLEIASQLGPSRRDAFQFLGRAYLALGRTAEALAALRRALELAEAEPRESREGVPLDHRERQISSVHYQLALALRRSGDEETAAIHFDAAKRHSARLAESSRELLSDYLEDRPRETRRGASGSVFKISALAELGADARLALEQAVRKSLAQTYFNLGVLQMRAEHFSRAADLFEQAAQLEPAFARLQYSLGVALFNSGEFGRATLPLARALAEDPANDSLRRMLALAWLNSKDYARAVELLRDDRQRELNPSLQYAYGLALVRSGRAAEAEAIFARLLIENSDWPELNVVLGQAYAQQDDFDAAIRSLNRAIELQPDVAEAHATLGEIFLRQGRLDEAEAALRAEHRLHPGDTRAQYTLAVVLDLNRKTEEALRLLRSLLEVETRYANARYLLGKILLAEGEMEEAAEQLEAAARLSPEDANIHYQLGQAYQKLGRTEEARQAFDTFRQLKQSPSSEGES